MDQSDDPIAVNERRKYELHECIVFAIELTPTMLEIGKSHPTKSHLQIILEALQESMAHSVITLPNTGYGCYLFNSAETSEGCRKGVQRVFALRDLNHRDMKTVYEILEENTKLPFTERPYIPLHDRFHPMEDDPNAIPLHDALLTLQNEISTKKEYQKLYNIKKIFLFTDNDTPVDGGDKHGKDLIRNVCNDLDQSMVTISPFFLNSKEKSFDNGLYSEVMRLVDDSDANANEEDEDDSELLLFDGPSTKPIDVDDIKERITRRKEIKRIQFQCPLIFSPKLIVGLKGYSVYTHETSTKTKYLYETEDYRKNVYSVSRYTNKLTAREYEEVRRLYRIGSNDDDYILLNGEQESEIQKYDQEHDTFLRIIGFKDEQSGIKLHYNSSTSPFVVPDEDSYMGSTRTLSALYQSLKKLGKVVICFGKIRKSSQPTMYALQSTKRKLSSDSKVYFPEGFFLIRLPYLDDIRQFPKLGNFHHKEEDGNEDKFKTKTRQVLRELKKNMSEYVPSDYKNPSLQQHYRTLHDYLLQVEQDVTSVSIEEMKLRNDDTLSKVHQLREMVIDSELSEGSLSRHLNDWNKLYNQL